MEHAMVESSADQTAYQWVALRAERLDARRAAGLAGWMVGRLAVRLDSSAAP